MRGEGGKPAMGKKRETLLRRFHAGEETAAYRFFGAHRETVKGVQGWRFRLWAPHAKEVYILGSFNDWREDANSMFPCGEGIWEAFLTVGEQFDSYRYLIITAKGKKLYKSDPYAFHAETRPNTASKLYDFGEYIWHDAAFLKKRRREHWEEQPLNIYELHAGSWKKRPNGDFYDYRSLAEELAPYVKDMGYDAVELLPITEYPLDDSWGYQCTGYFAPTSRYGTPEDLRYFVDTLHRYGIRVLLDWVPAHFCEDSHGLACFDGAWCYEYADEKKRRHKSWGTSVFDFGSGEVRSFLLSSACCFIREYHIDGLRVDAVASMLYLDYDRREGEWTPNRYGGRENLEAIEFLQLLNRTVLSLDKGLLMIAEESTAWPRVTSELDGGLGFSLKWNMGWMNDMCHYLKMDPFFRAGNHKDVTFSLCYAFSERFLLPMSHDEVVHMKGSLRGKMPGDDKMALAGVRGFYSYMLAHPGKKLSIMGTELGQWHEWDFRGELDWYLLNSNAEKKEHEFFRDIHALYHKEKALYQQDFGWEGFEWLVADDNMNNIVVFLRRDKKGGELICAVNFSPVAHGHYRFGVPPRKQWRELLNTEDEKYGGDGFVNRKLIRTENIPSHGREQSIDIRIPPLGAVFLKGSGTLLPKQEIEEEQV